MEADVVRSIEEQLSAFIDGELPDEELQLLVRRLEREEAFRATLVRYSLLGNIMRNDPVQASSEAFRARIMAEISSESEAAGNHQLNAKAGSSWSRPLVAAAVVAIIFVGVINTESFENILGQDINGIAGIEQSESLAGRGAAQRSVSVSSKQAPRLDRKASIKQERMTSYLVSHSERARPFQGPMADSRIFIQQASF